MNAPQEYELQVLKTGYQKIESASLAGFTGQRGNYQWAQQNFNSFSQVTIAPRVVNIQFGELPFHPCSYISGGKLFERTTAAGNGH
jgi:hypothetical protein